MKETITIFTASKARELLKFIIKRKVMDIEELMQLLDVKPAGLCQIIWYIKYVKY